MAVQAAWSGLERRKSSAGWGGGARSVGYGDGLGTRSLQPAWSALCRRRARRRKREVEVAGGGGGWLEAIGRPGGLAASMTMAGGGEAGSEAVARRAEQRRGSGSRSEERRKGAGRVAVTTKRGRLVRPEMKGGSAADRGGVLGREWSSLFWVEGRLIKV
ncbi:uncharacterized protein A4U43_C04F27400 [Asparagus officinalis]|uniref:Uncharacterized protein n=1 Tax=Asparagus officinalis TaxID=4686 RepID=A0A5P1F4S0_ASPOF|nr:uncharacterized protein A4U43_C04F27400 [Asparagus officinalis]